MIKSNDPCLALSLSANFPLVMLVLPYTDVLTLADGQMGSWASVPFAALGLV